MHLFAYGTLMCAELMQEISGCNPPTSVPATLQGYTRRAVKGLSYPGIFPDAGGLVQGCLYQDLPDSTWASLDRFEGEMYAREQVQVALEEGTLLDTLLQAEVYVVRPEFLHHLDTMDWDFAAFLARYEAYPGISLASEL
ncbi:MAG: gamma-glutamylcyclotransferase family protein [Candidatus Electrothrix aestuarii]|uniref:Putative gamma-glutamylcyclotransferase n=1 Tax=Candidatus Electrothrix aestuarii TaxID=3062594 RepID=A0AAU8LVJ3_9BACT|nr:gamma-glutamylcyclotransferase family protein [Candidatus Electrothrix aestuarii]